MARSEIDDIFAAKKSSGKAVPQPVASTSTSADVIGPRKKKKSKKRKGQIEEVQDPGINEERPKKKRAVETILDPSTAVPSRVRQVGKGASTPKKAKEDLDRFRDSRGTGPREWKVSCRICDAWSDETLGRKTEEGLSIYKEAELGINVEAGGTLTPTFPQCNLDLFPGTPLCPFDCDCCKLSVYIP